jgi:plastocyanin
MDGDDPVAERRCPVPHRTAAALAVLCLAAAVAGAEEKKLKKPALELRSSPRFAFSPANVLFTAELKGGDNVEELYCPEVEWEWGDGGKSVTEGDCDPWAEGATIERRFTANHTFQFAGIYRIKVTLRKTGKNILSQSLALTIRAGLGDTSPDPG